MKAALLTIWLCISAVPVFAAGHSDGNPGDHHKPAPAPLIGLGVPVALAVGGVLLGTKLLKRKR